MNELKKEFRTVTNMNNMDNMININNRFRKWLTLLAVK